MTPTEFLRQRNIVAKNKTDLIIGFDNGTEENLIELLESYHKSELKLLGIADVIVSFVCDNCQNKEGKELKTAQPSMKL
jgi:hypothetical protein